MTRVKICGITNPQDARVAADCGAWAIGLVFHPQSPRCVSLATAQAIGKAVPRSVLRVGVFMDQPIDEVRRTAEEAELDLIQLHGRESDEDCRSLGIKRCMKAFVLESPAAPTVSERPARMFGSAPSGNESVPVSGRAPAYVPQ